MNKELLIDDIIKEKASNEKIVLPRELDEKISETIANLPERGQVKGKTFKKVVTAAAIMLISITGLSIVFPAYARNLPVVESVFQFLSDKNMIDKDYVNYKSDLNLSKTSNGVTVTINSIVYDGIELSIGYTVESKEEFKTEPHILEKDFKINGKKTSFASGGTGNFINKNTYVGVDSFEVSKDYLPKEIMKNIVGGDVNIPDNFIMDLNIREFLKDIKGEWGFKFKVSLDKIKGKVKEAKTSIDLSEIAPELKVNEVIFTPINTVLRTTQNNTNSDEMVTYFVFDDKGRNLQWKGASGHGSGESSKLYQQYTFKNIYKDTKSVTFIPLTSTKEYRQKVKNANGTYKEDSKEVLLNLNGTTVLSEGKFGDYKITQVEILRDKTIIHYECTNLLSAEPYGLLIVDESGKEYSLKSENVKVKDGNKFVGELGPLSKDQKYTLKVTDLEKRYDMKENLKFNIEVK